MPQIRRATYLFLRLESFGFVDVERLLHGVVEPSSYEQVRALSLVRGGEYALAPVELEALKRVPSDRWVSPAEVAVDGALSRSLAEKGLLVSDEDDRELQELRHRDERLSAGQWSPYAALYHFLTKWRDVDLGVPADLDSREEVEAARETMYEFVRRYGKPPPHFAGDSRQGETTDLPLIERRDGLYELLLRRRTTRTFDATSLSAESLATVLRYVWGCHGYAPIDEGVVNLKRTSPSGGGLHPIEVYPLVLDVSGIAPGLYHYSAERHALTLVRPLSREEAGELADLFTAGQRYPSSAQALFVMTARFYRNFWKYRRHPRAYAVLMMDAAHLSQTFYLVCAELGLGAFVTAAINGIDIEEALELDGFEEGAIAICGCGCPAARRGLDPTFLPYVPRETRI
jgi:putative peptide maturation dehydrogenase